MSESDDPSTPETLGLVPIDESVTVSTNIPALLAQVESLINTLSSWNSSLDRDLVNSFAVFGEFLEVWENFPLWSEHEPSLVKKLSIASVQASSSLGASVTPCWGHSVSGAPCKNRGTAGHRCEKHSSVEGIQHHLDQADDENRNVTPVCQTCGETFTQEGTPPVRCSICPRSVHASCLARKLSVTEGVEPQGLEAKYVSCEACYRFLLPYIGVYLKVRRPSAFQPLNSTVLGQEIREELETN